MELAELRPGLIVYLGRVRCLVDTLHLESGDLHVLTQGGLRLLPSPCYLRAEPDGDPDDPDMDRQREGDCLVESTDLLLEHKRETQRRYRLKVRQARLMAMVGQARVAGRPAGGV